MKSRGYFRKMLVIMNKELTVYFTTPIAYIVFAAFLLTTGFYFFVLSPFFFFGQAELREFFDALPVIFSITVPAVTMRLISEERHTGSLEILMTLPVTSLDVAMGKFLAATVFVSLMLVPTLMYVVTVSIVGSLDPGPVAGGYIGAVLLGATFSSIGVFASSISKNQIIAFMIGVGICITLTMIDYFLFFLPAGIVKAFQYFGLGYHFKNISKGIIDTRDIIYFLSIIAVAVLGTVKIIEERR
ncbi:MAG TPA: ABC transporter [Spirochaetota bacterium]|nr:ABC transporter [Spirochaetota bacterium]HQP48681.1 ABC transporter [Spirochaetota bacterium]